ncbi:MAG: hypothetical protein RIM99_06460 [Cyclobacteriaceae bacterium]
MRLHTSNYQGLANLLGWKDIKAVRRNLKRLVDEKWISLNNKTGYYYLSGFDQLRRIYELNSRFAIRIKANDLDNIKALEGGAIYIRLHKNLRWKIKSGQLVQNKRSTFSGCPTSIDVSEYFLTMHSRKLPVSANGVSKFYPGISPSKAHRIKHQAVAKGYIKTFSREINTGYDQFWLPEYRKTFRNCFVKGGKIYVRECDMIEPKVGLYKRPKLKRY